MAGRIADDGKKKQIQSRNAEKRIQHNLKVKKISIREIPLSLNSPRLFFVPGPRLLPKTNYFVLYSHFPPASLLLPLSHPPPVPIYAPHSISGLPPNESLRTIVPLLNMFGALSLNNCCLPKQWHSLDPLLFGSAGPSLIKSVLQVLK